MLLLARQFMKEYTVFCGERKTGDMPDILFCKEEKEQEAMTQTDPNANVEQKTIYEELQVAGEQLLTRVKEVVREGNVRRLIIKGEDGHTILELPLTVGVVGILAAPQLAAIGALCALVTRCSIQVIRVEGSESKVEEAKDDGPSGF
jgi:uncharacterized protein DUF4342